MADAPIYYDHGMLLAKVEATYGNDANPVFGADAMLPAAIAWKYVVNTIDVARISPYMASQVGHAIGARWVEYTITMPFGGPPDPAAGAIAAPEWDAMMQAGGMKSTSSGGPPLTTYTYTPFSRLAPKSVTMELWHWDEATGSAGSALKWEARGCRHNWTLNLSTSGENTLVCTGIGIYVAPSDAAWPGEPVYQGRDWSILRNTTVTLGGRADRFTEMQIDANWAVKRVEEKAASTANVRAMLSRAPNASPKFSVNPEAMLTATHDRWATIIAGTDEALAATIATNGGASIAIAAPRAQYESADAQGDDQLMRWAQPGKLLDDNGDDWISIAVTYP